MKITITLLVLAFFSLGVSAQYGFPIDFENAGELAVWTQFSNNGDAPENFTQVENPDKDGINPSDSCAKLIVLDGADQWAGAFSSAYGDYPITDANSILEYMVYKDKISRCCLKVEGDPGGVLEMFADNTKTGEWELIVFDATSEIGKTHNIVVFMPDFPADPRTSGGTNYIDNIRFQSGWTSVREVHGVDITVYPNPTADILTVKYPEIERVTISNMVGQMIRSVELQKVDFTRLDVADLTTGVYFLTLESARGKISSKFIKE
ncbi:MAG: T9SS type A sorting domain-containing protein [Bacteroidales bacterium]|nr:T9SS type A sorting domain-containing protein [Bacteroidales bacterium]